MMKKKNLIIVGLFLLFLLIMTGVYLFLFNTPKQETFLPPFEQETRFGISVDAVNSTYKSVTTKPSGWFNNGQEADIMLSGFGFNDAGGPLLFNHPGGVAASDKHLILADRNNNRVLIWNTLPEENTPPDLVLGQEDFTSNDPGETLDKLNWPVGVATDGIHLVVADTYNDRILIWNTFPTQNGQPADIALQKTNRPNNYGSIEWPWAVWTDGEKLVVTSTPLSSVLIWNTFPTRDDQRPDVVINLDDFGTPRTIGSDGTNLVIGDHNAFQMSRGNFFWKTFPTKDNQKYDFFMKNASQEVDMDMGEIMWGPTFTPEGKFLVISDMLHVWEYFPQDENDQPTLSVGRRSMGLMEGYNFGGLQSGDGSGMAYAGGRLYISLSNGNKIVGFKSLPTESNQEPDFVIGSPDIHTNTLETEYIISNPVPVTDGKSLFVSSDFDRKLYVWKSLPDESGVKPDYVYNNLEAMWDNSLHNGVLVLAGKQTVYIWESLPLEGEMPDIILQKNLGSIQLQELRGVTMDDKYFYLADEKAGKVYVWEGVPDGSQDPIFSIDIEGVGRISSDGKHLVCSVGPGSSILIYEIDKLPNASPQILTEMFNLQQGVLVYDSHLFVADTNSSVVHIWTDIEDAKEGKKADIILGEKGRKPQIGRSKLFWPAGLTFDGSYLWVGEFKFSERLLRFSVR